MGFPMVSKWKNTSNCIFLFLDSTTTLATTWFKTLSMSVIVYNLLFFICWQSLLWKNWPIGAPCPSFVAFLLHTCLNRESILGANNFSLPSILLQTLHLTWGSSPFSPITDSTEDNFLLTHLENTNFCHILSPSTWHQIYKLQVDPHILLDWVHIDYMVT